MFGIGEHAVFMPVLAVIFTLVIIVTFMIMRGKQKTAEISAISQKSFEQLATELKQEMEGIKKELTDIKGKISSVDKMMKDVQ